jgi:hypothetical protein
VSDECKMLPRLRDSYILVARDRARDIVDRVISATRSVVRRARVDG